MENSESYQIVEDLRQSPEYGKYIEAIGWRVEKIGEERIFIRKLGPVSIMKLQRNKVNPDKNILNKLLKKYRVMMVKVEPLEISQPGFRLSNWPLLGTKTLRVNLRPSEEEIFNSFKKDNRYTIKKCSVLNAQCSINNYDLFYEIWRKSAKRKKLWIPGKKEYESLIKAFGKKCFCITIGDQAGAVVLVHKKTAFYYYAGATKEGTKLDLPYLVVWEAVKMAKKMGCKIWDFEGIYDNRWPNKGWKGFSHFKKSFGGREIEFPGSYEKWRWPF
jgi:hypothetical protein